MMCVYVSYVWWTSYVESNRWLYMAGVRRAIVQAEQTAFFRSHADTMYYSFDSMSARGCARKRSTENLKTNELVDSITLLCVHANVRPFETPPPCAFPPESSARFTICTYTQTHRDPEPTWTNEPACALVGLSVYKLSDQQRNTERDYIYGHTVVRQRV